MFSGNFVPVSVTIAYFISEDFPTRAFRRIANVFRVSCEKTSFLSSEVSQKIGVRKDVLRTKILLVRDADFSEDFGEETVVKVDQVGSIRGVGKGELSIP